MYSNRFVKTNCSQKRSDFVFSALSNKNPNIINRAESCSNSSFEPEESNVSGSYIGVLIERGQSL